MTERTARRLARDGLLVLVLLSVPLGAWAVASPRSFYRDFPGLGRHWVALDGPYNEHLVRDFGALNLAIGILAVCAAVWVTRSLVVAAALAWAVYSLPHLAYHLFNLGPYDPVDQVGILVGLLVAPALALLLLVVSRSLPARA